METSPADSFWRLEHIPKSCFSQSLISILDLTKTKEIRYDLFNTQSHLMEFHQDLILPWRIYKTLLVDTYKNYQESGLENEIYHEDTEYIFLLWSNEAGIKIRFDLFKFYWHALIFPSDENIVIWMPSARILATVIEEHVSLWEPNTDNPAGPKF
ncbi:MAG: hypothetical protein IPO40_13590 [Fibrobacteres bacterium]|nr:hypothetical protein [Fibrobacterota bacterium]